VFSASAFWVALATAERRVFSMGRVAAFFENFRIEYASLTLRPRIRSRTSRILRGLIPTLRATARALVVAMFLLSRL
jgi:hypothetical protein